MARRFDFSVLQPEDGLRVERVQLGDPPTQISLHAAALSGGERVVVPGHDGRAIDTVEMVTWDAPSPADEGDCDRLQAVMEAVARYFTLGGRWKTLQDAILDMYRMVPYGGVPYPGWHYHSCEQLWDDDLGRVVFRHVFVSDEDRGLDTEAAVWTEGIEVRLTTLGRLVEERRQDDEGGGPVGDVLELPGDEDPAPAQIPDRSSEA